MLFAVCGLAAQSLPSLPNMPNMVGSVEHYLSVEGDDLLSIAQKYGLAIDHLCFANSWPTGATGIYPGTEVTVPKARVLPQKPPPNGFVINLPERGLFFFRDQKFVRFYPISVGDGQKAPTPVGTFRIVEKIKDPTWYPPSWAKEKGPVGPGPDNPLGDRWLGLSVGRYGIHSTSAPINVGNDVTHGCIRMYPDDLRELFEQAQVGWSVRIEYETAKIGTDQSGKHYLVTFPDCYNKSDPQKRAKSICGALWNSQLSQKAAAGSGLPLPLD